MNTPRPERRAEDFPTRAMRVLTEAAEFHERPIQVLQPAMARAAHVLMALVNGGGDGQHEVRILVSRPDGDLEYTLPYAACGRIVAFPEDGGEHMVVVLLAIAYLVGCPGTMTLRSKRSVAGLDPRESTLRGWRLGNQSIQPMAESELFTFTCTTRSGEPTAPEPGTRFRGAFQVDSGPCPTCP